MLDNWSHIFFSSGAPATRARPQPRPPRLRSTFAPLPPPPSHCDLEFVHWLLTRAGVPANLYRENTLLRRLPACLRRLNVDSPADARDLLFKRPELLPPLLSDILLGVTSFFRDPDVFQQIARDVLPALAANPHSPLRIWSAACSDGSELYSLAILADQAGILHRCHLQGSDIRSDAIDRAASAVFEADALTNLPPGLVAQYFDAAGSRLQIADRLRLSLRFTTADLLAGPLPGPWHLIAWRNMAIYLQSSAANELWRQLASTLAPGGFLITGKAERPPAELPFTRVGHCIFQKD